MYSLCDQRHKIMILFIVIRKMKQLRGVHKSKNPIGKKNGWKMKLHCYYYSKKILKNPIISFEMNFNQFTCFVTKSLKILAYMPCYSLNLYLFKDYKYVNKLDIVYSYI